MDDFDERPASPAAPPVDVPALLACAAVGALVALGGAVVVALRVANRGDEPEGMNWWLVTWIVVGLAYTVAGTALLTRRGRRLLGGCFVVVGLAAMIMAVATQYRGYADDPRGHRVDVDHLGRSVGPTAGNRRARRARAVAAAGTAVAAATAPRGWRGGPRLARSRSS